MMANKKTVDPTGTDPSVKVVGIRLTAKQVEMLDELASLKECSRSEVFRRLLEFEYASRLQPEPF